MSTCNLQVLVFLKRDEIFNISELMEEVIKKYENKNITKEIIPRVYMNGRKNLIQEIFEQFN